MHKTENSFYVDLLNSENWNRFRYFVHNLQDKRIYLCYNAQCKGRAAQSARRLYSGKYFFSPYRKENALW